MNCSLAGKSSRLATPYSPTHRVLSPFIGPNGRHATLVTCWIVESRPDHSHPKLTTAWVQPHRNGDAEMTAARQYDSVRTTAADTESIFDGRTIPTGTEGMVLEGHARWILPGGDCVRATDRRQ